MIALFGTFLIMIIILAVLALIVVKALTNSPWGTFTVAATIPIAIIMGIYGRYIRPAGRRDLDLRLRRLMLAIVYGQSVAEIPTLAPYFTFTGTELCWILIGYGFVASVLPVWLLLAPRDYLSTFLKIGTIVGWHRHLWCSRPADAGADQVHRRLRPGLVGRPVPVPVHHHRLRRGLGLPCPDRVGHDAQADRQRGRCPLHRLWRDADGILRRHHGAGRGLDHRPRHLLHHEQPRRPGRHAPPRALPPPSPTWASRSRPS